MLVQEELTLPGENDPPRNRRRDTRCPPAESFKPLNDIETDFSKSGEINPEDNECRLENEVFLPRSWAEMDFTWKASSLCHKPLYFEEIQLERYGNTRDCLLQPAISGARFVANVAVLPYRMGMSPPLECKYTLGYYRPGNCAPHLRYRIPFSPRGALLQGAAVTGLILLIP